MTNLDYWFDGSCETASRVAGGAKTGYFFREGDSSFSFQSLEEGGLDERVKVRSILI